MGQATSYIGDGLRTIAIPLLVFQLTGSALNLGITFALEWFPFGIFSVIGGSLADRLNRKRLMIACDIVRFAIIATFAAAYRMGWLNLAILYGGIVLHSICGAVFNGGQASSIPYVLGKARATRAVAALVGTESAVGTVAPPLGGALFGVMGPFPALVMNAATYVASLFSLSVVHDLGPERASGLPTLREVARDIGVGFHFLWADRAMRLITLSSFVGNFVGMAGFVAIIPFIKRDLGGNDAQVGLVFGALGLGAVVGSFLAARIHYPFGKLILACYFFGSIVELPIIWAQHVTVMMAGMGLANLAGGLSIAHVLGWRMRIIPEETVGRVFGAVRLLALGGTLPGALVAGALADAFGARFAFGASVFGSLAVTLAMACSRTIREERR